MTFTHALSTNNYGPARFIVSAQPANGTHTTIASAMAAAVSGDTIYIRQGTYTENVTMKAGVLVSALLGSSQSGTVAVIGTWTISGVGVFTLAGLNLVSNSAPILSVGGSATTFVDLFDCQLVNSNNTAISYTTTNSSSTIAMYDCSSVSTGFALYNSTSLGTMQIFRGFLSSDAAAASSNSAGDVSFFQCIMSGSYNTSGSGGATFFNCRLDNSGTNITPITTAGTGSLSFSHGDIFSGSAASVVVGSGTEVTIDHSNFGSSATNVLTGAGTLEYAYISFTGSSSGHNVTTSTALAQLT